MKDYFTKEKITHLCAFVCGLVIGGVTLYLICHNDTEPKEEEVVETQPDYAQVYGIDVSFWQGHILWNQLLLPCEEDGRVSGKIPASRHQRPVQFAFIRATKSSDIVDTLYQRNYDEAKRLGIPCGAYHFLTDTVSGQQQAAFFMAHARFQPGDLPPVLDVEIDSPAIVEKAREWLEIVEDRCGVNAIIYTNNHVYVRWIKDDPVLSNRDLWLAQPRGDKPEVASCRFWQFSHSGHIYGIIDNVVDLNLFNGTKEELQAYIEEKGLKEMENMAREPETSN